MEIKRTIKKIAALAGGALFAGATLAGAFAALDDLPQPYVSSAGVFEGHVVVGTMGWNPNIAFNAAAATGLAQDVAVGMDVATAFGQISTSGATGGDTTTVEGGVQFSAPGVDFFYGDELADIKTTFGDGTIDPIFEDGTYSDSKGVTKNTAKSYTQKLIFQGGTGEFLFGADTETDEDPAGQFLKFSANDDIYEYELKIASGIDFDDADADTLKKDFKGTTIELQGRQYTISNAEGDLLGNLEKLELMSGARTAAVAYQETQSFNIEGETYEVTVNAITSTGTGDRDYQASVTINGNTFADALAGDTYTVDGLEIGIDTVYLDVVVPTNSKVHFFLGANKLLLEDGEPVQLNDEEIDDWTTLVTFDNDAAGNKLNGITIAAQPESDHFLAAGDAFVDPIFGSWQVVFGGVNEDMESLTLKASDDKGTFTFMNNNDKKVELPFVADGAGALAWGKSKTLALLGDDGLGNPTGLAYADGATCTVAANANECNGFLFLVTSAGGEAALFEINSIKETGSECTLKDLTNDREYEDQVCDGTAIDTTLGDIEITITAGVDVEFTTIELSGTGTFMTSNQGELAIATGASPDLFVALTDNDGLDTRTMTVQLDGSDDIEFDTDVTTFAMKEESDYDVGVDDGIWGTYFKINTNTKQSIEIMYPEEQVTANVFLAPADAATTVSTSGAVNVNYITDSVSRTDTDFASATPTKPVILIGGPSVNQLVNGLAEAGKTWTAAEYPENTAIIQLIEDAYGTNDALIVAGYAAADTNVAGRVLAARLLPPNQFKADLTGDLAVLNTAAGFSGVAFE